MTQTKTKQDEMMQSYVQMVTFVQNSLKKVEMELKRMKIILSQLEKFDPNNADSFADFLEKNSTSATDLKSYREDESEVVEGVFDGCYLLAADQKKYPVPVNYASKTKLIPGDVMKLKIQPDGRFIYKLINPAERTHIKAILSKTDDNKFTANTEDGKVFFLNQAAVSFFAGALGDELYIIINAKEEGHYAAIEAIIKK